MARIRDPNRDKAKELYLASNGEKLLKDIAAELDKSDTQIRKWKSLDKWDDELKGNVTIKTKSNVTNEKARKAIKETKTAAAQIEVIENDELTDKQRLFCIYYLKYFNATKAYQKSYECTYATAMVEGHRHLRNPKINAEIDRLKKEHTNELKLDVKDVIQKYIDIAFADMTDFVEFGYKEVTNKEVVGFEDDGKPIINENTDGFNYVDIKDSSEVDGTIITEVKQGKDGVSIKLSDRMKAFERLEKYVGYMSEEQKARIDLLKSKIPNANGYDPQAQITALADLINNPAPERVLSDD